MLELVRWLMTTVVMAWIGFAIMRSQNRLILTGHGWLWVGLAGLLAMVQWPVNFWLRNPLICPITITLLYLLSLVGLAPDDTVLDAQATALSQWFKRGLFAAVGGTAGGLTLWALML